MSWHIDLCTCLVKDYDICCGTKYFDIDRIYALSLTMFQWAPPMGIIRWYSVDPTSGGCALVFVDPASGGCALVFVDPASGVVCWYLWTLPVGVVRWYSVDPANGG